ncbi:MAG: hypothetical protein IT327_24950 [Anaerolineae bacterium]|nr:hypothetical protein [Anaerolineae bacterium]
MPPQTFIVRILRPEDLLELLFHFVNVGFTPPVGSTPGQIVGQVGSYLVVYFQPQHIAEEAFFETAEGVTDPADPNSEFPSPPGSVRSILSGPSRLVFRLPVGTTIDYSLTGLLEALTQLTLNVSPLLTYGPNTGCAPWDQLLRRLKIPKPPTITFPQTTETAIEAPYRLILSPDNFSRWQHALQPVTKDALTELWHTRLGTTHSDGRPQLRAIWSPDYSQTLQPFQNLPFRMSLTGRDRNELVHLTSNYHIGTFWPDPVRSDRFMLTTLGAWLRLRGDWEPPTTPVNPPNQQLLTVEQWRHVATMGRDHYVRVVYAGFLFPFGHRASLVKVTERKFFFQGEAQPPGIVAYLFQRFFILVREPSKTYTNRDLPFRTVNVETAVTPSLNDPDDSDIAGHGQEAFWPMISVNQQPVDFQFQLNALDWEGRQVEFTTPLIFISQNIDNSNPASVINHYNGLATSSARRNRPFGGQAVAYAPHKKSGDTSLETAALIFAAKAQNNTFPHFLPTMHQADVDIPAVKQLLGKNAPARIEWDSSYTSASGNQNIGNKGDIFARLVNDEALTFATEKVGGMVAPDISISAISRAFGPTGGDPQKFADGQFNPLEIFDLNNVKLLGGISLGEIIKDLVFNNAANVGSQIPGLTTERDGDIIRTQYTWSLDQNKLVDTGLFVPNAGATFTLTAVLETPLNGGEPDFTITGELTNFSILLLPTAELQLVQLDFQSAKFVAEKDKKLDVEVKLGGIQFLGILEFVAQLSQFIPMDGFSDPPSLEISQSPPGVEVGFSAGIPTIGIGILTIQNISLGASFFLPFGKEPMNFHFAFCERQQPFILTVYIFGGGGFFSMDVGSKGVVMIEAALEFGVSAAINLGIASGEASMMAGFYFQKTGADFILTGYFRAYGSLSVLGIITVSLEFYLGLSYASKGITPHGGTLWGQASLTVKIEILFFSTSVSVSMEKEFAGSDPMFRDMLTPADWVEYTDAFAAYP